MKAISKKQEARNSHSGPPLAARNKLSQSVYSRQFTVNCGGRLLDLTEPKVMGILNVSPESFFDGAKVADVKTMLERVNAMLTEGAAIIDVGGMSTRPGAEAIPLEVELARVIPIIREIVRQFPGTIISIDTTKAEVARQAATEGATIINDVSAGRLEDPRLAELVSASRQTLKQVQGDVTRADVPSIWQAAAELRLPYILMHMQGTPADMQLNPHYDDVVLDVVDFLSQRVAQLRQLGVHDIIIDPGFGFGKTVEHNYRLLAHLEAFRMFDLPVMVGLSRKSMIGKVLDVSPEAALNGTTALHVLALLNGANILRVHDVKEAMEAVRLVNMFMS